ncbi:MAG: hypothetical protein WEB04_09270 [Dehalococcoidia bacterium]
MTTLQLPNLDARLAYLAVQYHLSRPGSELDPQTKLPVEHGLGEVARALEPQLGRAVVVFELSAEQQRRLVEAVAGAMNELKSYPLLAASGRSAAPPFHEALRRLFPDVAAEPDEATSLAGHMLSLRRRLERIEAPPERPPAAHLAKRSSWRFWDRGNSQ